MEALSKLGIDFKGMLLYIVNFGIIMFILARYLYKPLLNILDKRREMIEGSITSAERLKKEFQKKADEMEDERKKAHKKIKEEMDKLKKYSEEKQKELSKQLDIERATMLEQTHAEIEQKTRELIKNAEKRVVTLIKTILMDFVNNKIPEDVIKQSVEEAWGNTIQNSKIKNQN